MSAGARRTRGRDWSSGAASAKSKVAGQPKPPSWTLDAALAVTLLIAVGLLMFAAFGGPL